MQKNITQKALEIITIALKNQAYAGLELSAAALEVTRYLQECEKLRAENERLNTGNDELRGMLNNDACRDYDSTQV